MHILILGAGFGGLELASSLVEEFGDTVDVTLVDKGHGFTFGFSKLDVMFGKRQPEDVVHPYADLAKPGLRFVQAEVTSIDPVTKVVGTDVGEFHGDVLVIALGADLHPEETPGLVEAGHEFYTVAGAFALRDTIASFPGGRVVVGVTSTPFKCPPAPSETVLLMHDWLVGRGLRDESTISLVMPFGVPIPPSPAASAALVEAFDERAIEWLPERMVTSIDPDRHVVLCSDGSEVPFDLFLGVPVHRAPVVVAQSPLAVDGWIPVDPLTLETAFPDVYAVGDVTSVGTPKAGVFAEGQAAVVAARLAARLRNRSATAAYDGAGICYLEFGDERVGKVNVTFRTGETPVGGLEGPSVAITGEKQEFGTSRISRWFDRPWTVG
jgi:sulfide:quinone oxidoreductase